MVSTLEIQNLTDSTLVRGFVTADYGRGTIDILWSCLTAIFLSIWTVIHLPVPCFDIDRPDNFRRKVVRSRVGASLLALLAPELMLCIALLEIISAYATGKKLEKLSIEANLAYGFFLDMGGFCLRAPTGRCHQLRIGDIEKAITASNPTAGIKDATTASDTPAGLKDDITASDTAVEIKDALSHSKEWVQELKRIKESDIEDLAKSDSVTKFFACFQGLWVLTQAISRIYQHKALSLLEVTTSAYICCAVGIYAFWWKKPQNCSVPIMIACSNEAIDELSSSAYKDDIAEWTEFVWAGRAFVEFDLRIDYSTSTKLCMLVLSVLSLIIFGSVHLASWNSRLASTIELWMWRGSSLYCVIYAGLFSLSVVWDHSNMAQAFYKAFDRITYYGIFVYFIVRIYMIVEVFISLRALPASAFQSVQWSSFVPHI
ncbi:hypothetical protein JMJ35_002265 [Cladonia borealis]|uniref:Uncharacterized protein n=1 Tax=Cladonia borealis TaxID=184061 RepID=A0AA39UCV6_9LECA|nr:hypothetical protein JMJ35_002265 [Cladonia borealis]